MADFPAPVATMIKTPDPMQGINTMSGILGLQQQRQALGTGQAIQQQEQLKAGQAQGMQDFFSTWDPSQHVADDGSTDLDSALQSKEFKGAGNAKPAIMQSLLDIKNKQLGNKQALSSLNSDLVKQFTTGMGSLAKDEDVVADKTDPATGVNAGRAKIDQFMGNFGKLSPDAARIAQIYGPVTQHAPPGKLAAGVAAMQMQGQSASEQQSQQNPVPGSFDTGANIIPTTTNRATGIPQPTGQQVPKQVGPGVDVLSDAYGRQFRYNRQTNQLEPVGTGGQGAPQANPPRPGGTPSSFVQPVAGQKQVEQDVDVARKAGDAAPQVRAINDKLLNLSEQTRTGPGAQSVQKIAAAMGLPSGSNYQEINAYLERQAATAGQAMGLPNTNAGLHAAQQASGTPEYTPQALQEKVKFADALNSGAMAYRQGLDKLVGTGATPDYSKYQAYRSAWAQNFSPDVFRAEDALRRGDKKELTAIQSELGSRGMAEMKKRADNLRMLENGQLPQ